MKRSPGSPSVFTPLGSGLDPHDETIDRTPKSSRDYRTNKQVPVVAALTNCLEGTLTSDEPAARGRRRWDDNPPVKGAWTRQRREGVRAVSKWIRRVEPPLMECYSGVLLAKKVRAGVVYPYPLEYRRRRTVEMPPGAKWVLRDVHKRALGLVVAAHLCCQTKGLIISHTTMATLLGYGPRQTGTVMRQLVAWGLLESHVRSNSADENKRQANRYTVSAFAILYFDITKRRGRKRVASPVGESCQAKASPQRGDYPESTSRSGDCGVPGGAGQSISTDRIEDAGPVLDSKAEGVKPRREACSSSNELCHANAPLDLQPSPSKAPTLNDKRSAKQRRREVIFQAGQEQRYAPPHPATVLAEKTAAAAIASSPMELAGAMNSRLERQGEAERGWQHELDLERELERVRRSPALPSPPDDLFDDEYHPANAEPPPDVGDDSPAPRRPRSKKPDEEQRERELEKRVPRQLDELERMREQMRPYDGKLPERPSVISNEDEELARTIENACRSHRRGGAPSPVELAVIAKIRRGDL